jgi:hypothetical protein
MNLSPNCPLRHVTVALALAGFGHVATAQTMTFSSRVSFNAASSGLVTESFNGVAAQLAPAGTEDLGSPWDSASIGGQPGTAGLMVPGLQIAASGIGVGIARSIDQPNFAPGADPALYTHNQTTLVFNFTNGATTAAAFDYWNPFTDGTLQSQITVFDTSNHQIAFSSTTPPVSGSFFGVTSTVPIGSITILNSWFTDNNIVTATNISFGTATAIPEPASVATGLALFALGAVGVREHRRRKLASWTGVPQRLRRAPATR